MPLPDGLEGLPDSILEWVGVFRALKWCRAKLGKVEAFERHRVTGGVFGLIGTVSYPFVEVEAGPLILCMLLGASLAGERGRIVGMALGAVVGVVVQWDLWGGLWEALWCELWCDSCPWLRWLDMSSRWWVAGAFIPLGGLVAGKLSGPKVPPAGPASGAASKSWSLQPSSSGDSSGPH